MTNNNAQSMPNQPISKRISTIAELCQTENGQIRPEKSESSLSKELNDNASSCSSLPPIVRKEGSQDSLQRSADMPQRLPSIHAMTGSSNIQETNFPNIHPTYENLQNPYYDKAVLERLEVDLHNMRNKFEEHIQDIIQTVHLQSVVLSRNNFISRGQMLSFILSSLEDINVLVNSRIRDWTSLYVRQSDQMNTCTTGFSTRGDSFNDQHSRPQQTANPVQSNNRWENFSFATTANKMAYDQSTYGPDSTATRLSQRTVNSQTPHYTSLSSQEIGGQYLSESSYDTTQSTSQSGNDELRGRRSLSRTQNIPSSSSEMKKPPRVKKAREKKKSDENKVCVRCHKTETPEWRRDASGQRVLCNACGLHYAKQTRLLLMENKKAKKEESQETKQI